MQELSPNEAINELARRNLLDFTIKLWPQFQATDFHSNYYNTLDLFAKKKIKNLIITIPPQHGKSQGSSKYLPAFIFGLNPNINIALMSYSTTFARKFNRHLQRVIDTPEYKEVFSNVNLSGSNIATTNRGYLRNADEFEIVDNTGSFKAIGREGALTGNPVDLMIFDDLYKDAMEGNSPVVRENVIEMYKSVADTRLHNNSQQLCVFTRWHEDDLIGYFEKNYKVINLTSFEGILSIEEQEGIWYKLNYEAIKESQPTELDSRKEGQVLFAQRHSLNRMIAKRNNDPELFNCMYQGNPSSKEGLLYSPFKTYSKLPDKIKKKGNYTDTADTGDDFLSSFSFVQDLDNYCYITDVVYTQEPMEVTEISVSDMLNKGGIKDAMIESNNGGRGFARVIEKLATNTSVRWFHQSENKESRILTNASTVNKYILFPEDWATRWPKLYTHLTTYKKIFKANKHDDAADGLTGIVENNINRGQFGYF